MGMFTDMLENALMKSREYPSKTKKYLKDKEVATRAQRNQKRAEKNGEQFVMAPQFKKDARLERNKREIDNYNKTLSEKTAEAKEKIEKKLADAQFEDKWYKEHKAERDAEHVYNNRKYDEFKEYERLIEEGMEAARDSENWPEYERLKAIRNDLNKKFQEFLESPSIEREASKVTGVDLEDMNPFSGPSTKREWYVTGLARGINKELPKITPIATSNQGNIYRYHTTSMKNLPGILKKGLLADKGGEGFGKILLKDGATADELGGVYTISRRPDYVSPQERGEFSIGDFCGSTYSPYEGGVTLELKLPKKDYKKMSRAETNPEEYYSTFGLTKDGGLNTIQNGGRTDIFENNINNKYISNIITDDLNPTKDWESIIKNYQCSDDCEEWLEALQKNDFMRHNPVEDRYDWNEPLFNRLRKKLKSMQ